MNSMLPAVQKGLTVVFRQLLSLKDSKAVEGQTTSVEVLF